MEIIFFVYPLNVNNRAIVIQAKQLNEMEKKTDDDNYLVLFQQDKIIFN